MVDALRELHGTKKSYHHLCHIASMVREKAAAADRSVFENFVAVIVLLIHK